MRLAIPNGSTIIILNIIVDDCSREALWIEVGTACKPNMWFIYWKTFSFGKQLQGKVA
jgi:hypothetical protein